MDKAKFQATHQWVKDELKRSVDFWLKYGMDKEHGGVYTCVDRKGKIYSTDKSVWMQGRCGWIFAFLCTTYGKRDEWLEASRSCLDFLEEHCVNHEAGGRLYFTVTGDGKPASAPLLPLRELLYHRQCGVLCQYRRHRPHRACPPGL